MRLPSNYHYFDYAAGWPVREEALAAYVSAAREYGNPGSVHQAGQRALASLDAARDSLAQSFGCAPKDVVLTASATEANNLAVLGTIKAFKRLHPGVLPRVVISAIEHDSVREPAERMAAGNAIELVVLPVDKEKGVDLGALEVALDSRTTLVSVMHVNNETGTVLPIARISRLIADYRDGGEWPRLHVDAAQALAYVEELATAHADLVTYSGYKVGSVAGVAALVVKNRDLLDATIVGGGQEKGMRAGTEDVAAAVSFAKAVSLARASVGAEVKRMGALNNLFVKELAQAAPRVEENAAALEGAPHIVSLWIPDVHAQETVTRLDLADFGIGAGPACSARSLEPSKVLQSLGYDKQRAIETVRVSFGPGSTEESVKTLASQFKS